MIVGLFLTGSGCREVGRMLINGLPTDTLGPHYDESTMAIPHLYLNVGTTESIALH